MTNYLTQFDNMQAYENSKSSLDLPNVTYIVSDDLVIFSDAPIPPTPSVWMLSMKYNDGRAYTRECEAGKTLLTSDDIKPSGYPISSLTSVTIGDCITRLDIYAFSGCSNLTSAALPSSLTSISDSVFHSCSSLTSITIPNSVTSIGTYGFCNCYNMTNITLPSSLASINNGLLYGCSGLTSVAMPSGVTSINQLAFAHCYALTNITIPSGVTSIGANGFRNCSGLTSIEIPNSVTTIGGWAFAYCSSLQSITCLATIPPSLEDNAFNGTNDCPIYVPSGSVDAYKAATNWFQYKNRIQAITN